jgi:hypothetical protein
VWHGKTLPRAIRQLVLKRERDGHKVGTKHVSSNTQSLCAEASAGHVFRDVGITEDKSSRRYRGQSDLYYG